MVLFDAAMRLRARGLRYIHQCHDELVFCVDEEFVSESMKAIEAEMKTPPAWCSDLPLDCEVGYGATYGDA